MTPFDALAGVLYLDTTPRRDDTRPSVGFGSHGSVDADIEFARVAADRHAALAVGRVASDDRLGATVGQSPRWFANVGRGVKNPTFTERFGFIPDTFIGDPDLEPETSNGFEVGVVLTHGATTASLVYFHTALHDEIDGFSFDVARGGFTARNIDGESRRKGAEATLARLASTRAVQE